ncbi:Ale2p Ecym_4414 [Eremothecium cymbalariae DBVPG|uniref:TLC domain-containing protein n=1 Tax=Eremothecium cymbalariae (strain CBS 270.75 / DBVPG 7215 / KCTC 17166 / NRRL Y-17582) TaxID=931890 RepID=G8JTW2_ERECY|nr:hypothetical protein Ecym_4414 [Eremothecium cymbalariae DBVPG\
MNPVQFLIELPPHPLFTKGVLPFLEHYGIVRSQVLLDYLPLITYVGLFYHCWYLLGKHVIFPWLVKVTKTNRPQWLLAQSAVHLVSVVQSFVILSLCYRSYPLHTRVTHPTAVDRVFEITETNCVVASFAIGYFVWDTIISFVHSSFPFVLHGAVSSTVFLIGMKPYINYYGAMFLWFELSNPFLNLRWFLAHFMSDDVIARHPRLSRMCSMLKFVNDVVFITVFFGARIVYGYYKIVELALDFYSVRHHPNFLPLETAFILIGNLILDLLNAIWFWTMLKIAKRTISKRYKPTKSLYKST